MNTAKYWVLLWVLGSTATSWAGLPQVPNADFTRGDQKPEAWELQGTGDWVDRQVLAVHGEGQDSSAWWTRNVPMEPGQRYHFQVRARRASGSGMAITGPAFANRDHVALTDPWNWLGHVFRVPDAGGDDRLRVGHWHATCMIEFDVNYHVRGACRLEVQADQGSWHSLAVQDALGTAAVPLPDSLFPVRTLRVRLAAEPGPTSFQVKRLNLTASLDRQWPSALGETVYADLQRDTGELQIRQLSLASDPQACGRLLARAAGDEASLHRVAERGS